MDTDSVSGSKRPRQEVAHNEEKHLASPNLLSPAALAAARKQQHLEWARGLPTAPPHREETESSVAVLSNAAESYLRLVEVFSQTPSLSCLRVDFGRSEGKFLIRGLTPPLWDELRTIVSGISPLDGEHQVELRAPLRFITNEELAVCVQLPFVMDPSSFALGLRFSENETRPIAMAPVHGKDGQVAKVIKMYCASKSHKKRVLRNKTLKWSNRKVKVTSFGTSRKSQKGREEQ